jgi:hypothetical protein
VSDEWQAEWQAERQEMARMTPVGGERMSEERLDLLASIHSDQMLKHRHQAELFAALRAERAYAASLERKPLDGYDWRADLERIEQMRGCCVTRGDGQTAHSRLAAYIESLEAAIARVKGRGVDRASAQGGTLTP